MSENDLYKNAFDSDRTHWDVYTWVIGTVLSLIAVILTSSIVISTRADAITDARDRTISNSLIFGAQAEDVLMEADSISRNFSDFIRDSDFKNEDDFRAKMLGVETFARLRQAASPQKQVSVITIIDNDGLILNFSRWWPAISLDHQPINVSDRDFFLQFKEKPSMDYFIGLPFKNISNKEMAFYITRKLVNKNGIHLGFINVGIDIK